MRDALSPGSPGCPQLTLADGVGAGGGAGRCRVRVSARQELRVARVRPAGDRSQAECWHWGHRATVPRLRDIQRRLPPVHTLPDLGRPAAELLLIPCLKQDVGGIGDLGTSQRSSETERDVHPPPTHAQDPSRDSSSPLHSTSPVHPLLPGWEEELKFGTGAFGSHMCPRGWERPRGWLQTLPAGPTLRTKVWRLSGISRRVHLRTSCTAEQATSSLGLEPCGEEHRA